MMRVHALLIVAAGLLVAADAKDDAVKKDKAALKGTWQVIALEERGKAAPPTRFEKMRLVFSNDKMIGKGFKEDKDEAASYTIDPSKNPATLDIFPADGDHKGEKIPAIYVLNKDELKICASTVSGQERPKGFVTKESLNALMTLRREKK